MSTKGNSCYLLPKHGQEVWEKCLSNDVYPINLYFFSHYFIFLILHVLRLKQCPRRVFRVRFK